MLTETPENRHSALVAGAGNLLLADEGFGVHVVKALARRYRFPEEVTIYDAGTAGIYMAPVIQDHDHILFIDAVAAPGPPGSLYLFEDDGFWRAGGELLASPHQVGPAEVMALCRFHGGHPERIALLGVVPARIEPGTALGPEVLQRVDDAVEKAVELLSEWGFEAKERCDA